jgi:hypothetical protein
VGKKTDVFTQTHTYTTLSVALYIVVARLARQKSEIGGEFTLTNRAWTPLYEGGGHWTLGTATTTTTDAKKVDNWCNFGITPFEDGGVSGQYKEDFL